MDENDLLGAVLRVVLTELAKLGERFVPVNASNRHAHLCQADVEKLFGAGHRLTPARGLGQPGQYACQETVTIEGEKGSLSLRVVGPVRGETQVELSYSDCFKLGITPSLRMSGDTAGTPGAVLVNGARRTAIDRGVIVAARHLHLSPVEAEAYGLRDGDVVALQVEGPRAAVLENIAVRSGEAHSLELHIDRDEANACGLQDGRLCRILCAPRAAAVEPKPLQPVPGVPALKTWAPKAASAPEAPAAKAIMLDLSREPRRFLSEGEVLSAARDGIRLIRHAKDAIITPLARDAASAKGVELIELS